jgi:hypothetical protein
LHPKSTPPKAPIGWFKIVTAGVLMALLTSFLTLWLARQFLFTKELKPVTLTAGEDQVLDAKLKALVAPPDRQQQVGGGQTLPASGRAKAKPPALTPERYSEKGARREIVLTERELNALLARNTDLAHRLAIKLTQNLASAKLLVPLDPDLPFLGGQTLKVTGGLELRFAGQQPVVMLKGISLWGIPIPNVWLGGLKNVDLVQAFGGEGGFWELFAAGIASLQVAEGELRIKLKE